MLTRVRARSTLGDFLRTDGFQPPTDYCRPLSNDYFPSLIKFQAHLKLQLANSVVLESRVGRWILYEVRLFPEYLSCPTFIKLFEAEFSVPIPDELAETTKIDHINDRLWILFNVRNRQFPMSTYDVMGNTCLLR